MKIKELRMREKTYNELKYTYKELSKMKMSKKELLDMGNDIVYRINIQISDVMLFNSSGVLCFGNDFTRFPGISFRIGDTDKFLHVFYDRNHNLFHVIYSKEEKKIKTALRVYPEELIRTIHEIQDVYKKHEYEDPDYNPFVP